MMADGREERSISVLFRQLIREFQALIRENLDLARLEIMEKTSCARKGATLAAIGGAILHAGLLVFLAAAVCALALVLPLWAAALIVGAFVCFVGAVILASGIRSIKKASTPPSLTIETLKKEKRWLKQGIKD